MARQIEQATETLGAPMGPTGRPRSEVWHHADLELYHALEAVHSYASLLMREIAEHRARRGLGDLMRDYLPEGN